MSPIIMVAMQVISYLMENKDQVKKVVLSVQELVPEAAGSDKMAAVRSFIGAALNIEDQIEHAWPFVAPLFNLLVKHTKNPVVPTT